MIRLALATVAVVLVGGSQLSKAPGFNPDPVFPVGPISGTRSHQITKLDHVASALAGRRAIVNCWSRTDWTRLQVWNAAHHHVSLIDADGITFIATRRIELSPTMCQILAQAIARTAQQPLFTAWAVTVLAHEAAHASGIVAENRAECRAIVTEPRAAQLLGISRPLSERLQHIYRGTLYPTNPPRYRTPPCAAGRPGQIVPDTLGTAANLHLLEPAAGRFARSLPRWRNAGGGIGNLSPCSPIANRSLEVARFSYILLGPHGEYVSYSRVILHTRQEISAAIARYRAMPHCEIQMRRTSIREHHDGNAVALRPIPAAVARISARVRAFRVLFTSHETRLNLDTTVIFDRARRIMTVLFFSAPVGQLPPSLEAHAIAAAVQASHRRG